MFQQLIASRPARAGASQGTTASLVVHGAILTLAILAGAWARVIPTRLPGRQLRSPEAQAETR